MTEKTRLIEKQREFINRICKRYDVTYTELARQAKIASTTITRLFHEDALFALSSPTLAKISERYNIEPNFIQIGRVQVVGNVGAGAKVMLYALDDLRGDETIEAPQEAIEQGAVALKVIGSSMWPVYKDQEYVLYIKECDFEPSFIGRDCVIELDSGEMLIKTLQRGNTRGIFTLTSYNEPPIENAIIKWASPIKWTKKF